jgi:hypothetical protein
LTALACSSAGSGEVKEVRDSTVKAPAKAEPKTAESKIVTCYKGEITVNLPNGDSVNGGVSFVRRSLDQTTSSITEEVISQGSTPDEPARTFVVDMKVEGSAFKMKERGGAFDGTGALEGEPWKWTKWSSKARLPDGQVVVSEDALNAKGLVANKTLRGVEGQVVVTMKETYVTIPCDVFESQKKAAK